MLKIWLLANQIVYMGLQTSTNVITTHINATLKQNVQTLMGITHVPVQRGLLEMEH